MTLRRNCGSSTRGPMPEAEKAGQMVLTNQFISGLRPELQAKVVGSMDALVLKARFEEAKAEVSRPPTTVTTVASPTTVTREVGRRIGPRRCFNCGHVARSCSYERTARTEQEPHGRPRVTMGAPSTNTGKKTRRSRISQLRKELRQAS